MLLSWFLPGVVSDWSPMLKVTLDLTWLDRTLLNFYLFIFLVKGKNMLGPRCLRVFEDVIAAL